ncbi:hypothetical protein JCM10212_004406 [Sporobolomyces blumeae]
MVVRAPPNVKLGLVRGAEDQKLTWLRIVHFLFLVVPRLLIFSPLRTLWHRVLYRKFSANVQLLGRTGLADFVTNLAQYILSHCDAAQARILFDRVKSYERIWSQSPYLKNDKAWLSRVEVNGTAGRWIARPGTDRSKDDVVVYFIHGGGFVVDTGSNAQEILASVVKEFNIKRDVQVSVFCLDYRLAPEYKYPSQLVEVMAGYQYLVNTVGIPERKILLGGDSAGGNLATAFLLHLARPAPEIKTPKELGDVPGRPAAALLISPMVNLVSRARSYDTNASYDFIYSSSALRVACDYIGVPPPPGSEISYLRFNPLKWFTLPSFKFPRGLMDGQVEPRDRAWQGWKGAELFKVPYINPSIVEDDAWWKEACPPNGNTAVVWGGKEIFADDDEALYHTLGRAGVEPTKIYAELRAHDWILHDWNVPTSWKTKAKGPDNDPYYGFNSICDMIERVRKETNGGSLSSSSSPSGRKALPVRTDKAIRSTGKNSTTAAQASSDHDKEMYADVAASAASIADDAVVVNEGEGEINHLKSSMGESGVLVERAE